MKTNILTLIIPLVIGVILTGSLLMPVVMDATKDPKILDVVVIDGQSNASYNITWCNPADLNQEYTEAPYTTLLYYGTPWGMPEKGEGYTDYTVHNMYQNGAYVIGGYGPALANSIAHRDGHDVYYICMGVGGASIADLLPAGEAGTWGFSILDAALAAIPSTYDRVNYLGVGWAQGEADKEMAVDTYKGYFAQIQTAFSSKGFNDMYILETRENWGGNATAAQADLIESDPHVFLGSNVSSTFEIGDGYLMDDDPIHYSQKGRIAIAEQFGDSINLPGSDTSKLTLLLVIPVFVIIALVLMAVRSFTRMD